MKHKHHIIPKYEGGSDDSENIVELSVTQHAMWHFAEWQRKERWQDKLAWQGLAKIIGHEEAVIQAIKESCKEREPRVGWNHSEETKKKIGDSQKGKIISSESKSKMSASAKERCTPEWRKRQSERMKGRTPPNKGSRMSEKQKAKISQKAKLQNRTSWVWWNNGEEQKRGPECPGEGWKRGRGPRNIWKKKSKSTGM